MKTTTSCVLTFVVALVLTVPLRAQVAVPPLINYQGRVAVGGVNFDGAGSFKFALVNTDGTITYWSNDGTSTIGDEPAAAVPLSVAKGLYSVLLGDDSQANMSAVPASVFANADVRLRVWFDDGVNGSQLLAPDQRLAPTAYLADGAVTTASIAPEAVTSASIAAGAINGTHIAPGSLDFSALTVPTAPGAGQVLGFDGATLLWTSPIAGGNDGIWTLSGANTYFGGNVGVGGLPGTSKLTITAADALTLSAAGPYLSWKDTSPGGLTSAISSANGTLYFRMPTTANGPIVTAAYVDQFGLKVNGGMSLANTGSGGVVSFGTPNAESGMTIIGAARADVRFDGTTLKLYAGPAGGPPGLGAGVAVRTSGNVGIGTESPLAKLHVVGTIRTSAVTITGGADLAEPFAMSQRGVAAGTVVSIDPEHPGKLKRSAAAYDKKVAGIVSGANGIHPGISMIDEAQLEAGENVALSGRVYVKANASAGAIAPGDLLTTSAIPGEAMKADDHPHSQGAILGKAMTPLDESTGLVLVLVTLQ